MFYRSVSNPTTFTIAKYVENQWKEENEVTEIDL